MLSDSALQSLQQEITVHIPYLNVPEDLLTECSALTPDTCRFYEIAYRHLFDLVTEVQAWRTQVQDMTQAST